MGTEIVLRLIADRAKVKVPCYPDTPIVRRDLARQYNNDAELDKWVGEILQQLKDDNLDDSTIVFFFGNHGFSLAITAKVGAGDAYTSVTIVPNP